MKIKCLTTFIDGAERFEKDDVRTVADGRGAAFVAAGWAEDLAGRVATVAEHNTVSELDICGVNAGQGVKHG